MPDANRKIAGFSELSLGVNQGIAPNLIPPDQCVNAINVSFRRNFPTTRPPWANHVINNIPSTWTGLFQGFLHYDGEIGQSGWLVSRGGRLFFITDDTFVMSEVTPQLFIVTTADFTQPGIGSNVQVPLNGNPPVNVGDTVKIGTVSYTVFALFEDAVTLTQVGAGAGTVPSGSALRDAGANQIIEFLTNPPTLDFVYMFQAENYVIILAGQERSIIWDGKQCSRAPLTKGSLPSGVLGLYAWGRIWITRPDRRTFVAGDIVYGPSGTPQFGKRDAILKFTENDFLNEGGSFGVPYNAGPITSMTALATQDTSLGIGQILVGTTNMVFSVNAPTDRTTWKNLTYPIQTVSLIDFGPRSPRGMISINGDAWYRSEDGFRSFIVARRAFGSPGNTPQSHEIDPILDDDTKQLLFYNSGVYFDNKFFSTISPYRATDGIAHRGLAVINFDLNSTLRNKQAPAWEGIETGLNTLQIDKARIDDEERCFMFVQGANDLEFWELLTDGIADQFTTGTGNSASIAKKPIGCVLQTRAEDYGLPLELKRLIMAEIYLDDIADNVVLTISYKPDQFPNWIQWQTVTLCSTVSQCTPKTNPCLFQTNARGYAARLLLPQPLDACNVMSNTPTKDFHECQFQLSWTGHMRVRRFYTHTIVQSQPMQGSCPSEVECILMPFCVDNPFTYDSHP